ncbi:MAG: hypothetical protein GY700_05815 [Propionibacteriaceae bacterium]|nr:hypothetical protein [Propionibacteriaceae bacterium]
MYSFANDLIGQRAYDDGGRIDEFDFTSTLGTYGDADYTHDATNQLTDADYESDWPGAMPTLVVGMPIEYSVCRGHFLSKTVQALRCARRCTLPHVFLFPTTPALESRPLTELGD